MRSATQSTGPFCFMCDGSGSRILRRHGRDEVITCECRGRTDVGSRLAPVTRELGNFRVDDLVGLDPIVALAAVTAMSYLTRRIGIASGIAPAQCAASVFDYAPDFGSEEIVSLAMDLDLNVREFLRRGAPPDVEMLQRAIRDAAELVCGSPAP